MTTPITAADMHRIPACTANACGQDARNCQTREACQLPLDEDDLSPTGKAIVQALCIALALVAMCAAVSAAFV
jgi:hypothetical protein